MSEAEAPGALTAPFWAAAADGVPYRLAVVDLEEGWSMLANVVGGYDGIPPASGTAVEVTWVERSGRMLPAFREVGP